MNPAITIEEDGTIVINVALLSKALIVALFATLALKRVDEQDAHTHTELIIEDNSGTVDSGYLVSAPTGSYFLSGGSTTSATGSFQ